MHNAAITLTCGNGMAVAVAVARCLLNGPLHHQRGKFMIMEYLYCHGDGKKTITKHSQARPRQGQPQQCSTFDTVVVLYVKEV